MSDQGDLYQSPLATQRSVSDDEIKTSHPAQGVRGAKSTSRYRGRGKSQPAVQLPVPQLDVAKLKTRTLKVKYLLPKGVAAEYSRDTGTEIVVSPDATTHTHPILALQRELATSRLFSTHNASWIKGLITDIGAGMEKHGQRTHVHGLCPILTPADTYRQSTWSKVNPAFWCRHTMQEFTAGKCEHIAERQLPMIAAVSIHSIYYLGVDDLAHYLKVCSMATGTVYIMYAIFHRFPGTEGRLAELAYERQGGEVVCRLGTDIYAHDAMTYMDSANSCIDTKWGSLGWHEEFRVKDTYCYAFFLSPLKTTMRVLSIEAALGDGMVYSSVDAGKLFLEVGKYVTETKLQEELIPETLFSLGDMFDVTMRNGSKYTFPKTLFQECCIGIAGKPRTPESWNSHIGFVRNHMASYRLSANAKENALMPVAIMSYVKNMERDTNWLTNMARTFGYQFDIWNAAMKFKVRRTVSVRAILGITAAVLLLIYKYKPTWLTRFIRPGLILTYVRIVGTTWDDVDKQLSAFLEADSKDYTSESDLFAALTSFLPGYKAITTRDQDRDDDRARENGDEKVIDPVLEEVKKLTPQQMESFAALFQHMLRTPDVNHFQSSNPNGAWANRHDYPHSPLTWPYIYYFDPPKVTTEMVWKSGPLWPHPKYVWEPQPVTTKSEMKAGFILPTLVRWFDSVKIWVTNRLITLTRIHAPDTPTVTPQTLFDGMRDVFKGVFGPLNLHTDTSVGFGQWLVANRMIWVGTAFEEFLKWVVPGFDHLIVFAEFVRALGACGLHNAIVARILPTIIHYCWRISPTFGLFAHLAWNIGVFWHGCVHGTAFAYWLIIPIIVAFLWYRYRGMSVRDIFMTNYANGRATLLPDGLHPVGDVKLNTVTLQSDVLPPAIARIRVDPLKFKGGDTPGPRLVFGLSERPPIVCSANTANEVLAVSRAVQDTHADNPPPFGEALFKQMPALFIPFQHFGMHIRNVVSDLDQQDQFDEWIKRYPASKRSIILESKGYVDLTGELDSRLSCFIKQEKYFKMDTDGTHPLLPRMISATSASVNGYFGPFAWGLGKLLSAEWNNSGYLHVNFDGDINALNIMVDGFCKRNGIFANTTETGFYRQKYDPTVKVVYDHIQRYIIYYEADFSKFDGSFTQAAIALEDMIYEKYGIRPDLLIKLKDLRRLRKCHSRHAVSWESPYKRASGEVFTACGNTLLNLYIFLVALFDFITYVEDIFVAVCGDDHANGVKWTNLHHPGDNLNDVTIAFRQRWKQVATSFGFKLDISEHSNLHEMTYLSCVWWAVETTPIKTIDGDVNIDVALGVPIGRWLARTGWVLGDGGKIWRAHALLGGTFTSMEFLTAHVPIVRQTIAKIKPLLGPHTIVPVSNDWRISPSRKTTVIQAPVGGLESMCQRDWDCIRARYKLERSDCLTLFNLATSVNTVPVFISDKALRRMVGFDMPI